MIKTMMCPSCEHKYLLPCEEHKKGFKKCPKCSYIKNNDLILIENKVKKIIIDTLMVEENQVIPTAMLINDLNADSLDLMEIVTLIEMEFDFELPKNFIYDIITVQDIICCVYKRL